MNKEIIVSICCATYNHQKYIRDAIEGFLMQKTTFPFEILIHDDASTDGTADIIREYEAKYPDIIKPIYQRENQYSKGIKISQVYQFPRAQGKYIALCEGDDYWIDPHKLQKQVDYLERNPNVSFVATNYAIYDEKTNQTKKAATSKRIDFYTLLKRKNQIPTLTTCIRSEYIFDYIREINPVEKKWPVGDYPLWLYLSQKGKIGVIPEYTANYNKRQNSACHYTDIKKQYQFYLNVIDIARFYSNKYGTSTSIEKRIKRNKIDTLINYGYSLKNEKLMRKWVKYYFINQKMIPIKGIIKYCMLLVGI